MDKLHLEIKEDQKLFYTSDMHFGHRNILNFCKRPFATEKEMNLALIENWNAVVRPNDIIFNLGDFCWWDSNRDIQKIFNKLNGKIYFQFGNHDTKKGLREVPSHVEMLDDVVHTWIKFEEDPTTYEVVTSHYPLLTYAGKMRGVYHFFGHIHSGPGSIGSEASLPLDKNMYDVGVDNNGLYPIEFRDIIKKIKPKVPFNYPVLEE